MASLVNNCVFTATSGGTGDFAVSAAVTGYQAPAAVGVSDGKTYRYRAQSFDLSQWEEGSAIASSTATSFTRAVTASSAGGTTKVAFTDPPTIALTMFAADVLQFDDAMSLTAAQKAQARANLDVTKKNYIVNGAMMVSQENGTTAGTATAYYPVDQFAVTFSHGGGVSHAQVVSQTPAGSPNRVRVTVTSADAAVAASDFMHIAQWIEGYRVADLKLGAAAAKSIALQFGVKAPAGTYSVIFLNSAANRSYVAEYTIAAGEANTDVVKSVTVPGDITGTWAKDNTAGLVVRWGLMAGTTFQQAAGSWGTGNVVGSPSQFNFLGTNGNVFELFDVGLYEGTIAPPFQVPDFASELDLCMRYWEKTYDYGTAPGTIALNGAIQMVFQLASGTFSNASGQGTSFQYRKSKRAAPTVTGYSTQTGASGKAADFQGGADVNIAAIASPGTQGLRVWSVLKVATDGILSIGVHFVINARM
ncbi:hypothetical protein [Bradyrhizobium cenepequi]